jgi:hypothetical protein
MAITRVLEILNGAALLPVMICLFLLGSYISREAVRRGLHALDWWHLPPSMSLAFAMFIFVAFVGMRYAATVVFYSIGQRVAPLGVLFGFAIVGMIIGLLCTIKAITEPDYGKLPWMASTLATVCFMAVLLFKG